MKKLAAILAVVGLGLAGFAGTCNLLQTSLTQIGATDTYAGALQNNTGANFLGHKFKITFVDAYGNIIDQRTNVSGCLRSWQNGTSDFFSVASTQPAASTVSAIASLDYSQPLTAGSTLATNSTVTGVTASLNSTTLTVAGTLRNNDAVTMVSPDVCAVVYNSSGNITVTQMSTLGSLNPGTSINFTMSITVPGSTVSSNTVTVWADGLENNVPTTPISSVST
ncbi:MAG: FxLYD domain-containing protein, partial [Chloroflexota bacterium]|nr:FxLYD domain-containing protein [Chloroflexota bacterium]